MDRYIAVFEILKPMRLLVSGPVPRFGLLLEDGFKPDVVSYNSLMKALWFRV